VYATLLQYVLPRGKYEFYPKTSARVIFAIVLVIVFLLADVLLCSICLFAVEITQRKIPELQS
jgi:hypothetical protein